MYQCPDCARILTATHCPCGFTYQQTGRLKKFTTASFYWNQVSQERVSTLLKSKSDTTTIIRQLFPDNDYMFDYVFKKDRAKWRRLLNLKSTESLLDLGAGWGALTLELSQKLKNVVACDSTLETLQFIDQRLEEEKITNVELCLIANLAQKPLPFQNNTFDYILLNGVLEWVAKGSGQNPTTVQIKILKEIKRVLKPTGILIITIENRFGFDYFLGCPDEHTFRDIADQRLKYTTIYPRLVSQIIMRYQKKQPYETYTHSYCGYQRIFQKAGYNTHSFAVLPNYHFPKYFWPLNGIYYYQNQNKIEHFFRLLNQNKLSRFVQQKTNILHWLSLKVYFYYLSLRHRHAFSAHYFLFFLQKK